MIVQRRATFPPQALSQARETAPTVWGLDTRQIHDWYWASRCVRVVRPGDTDVESRGPDLYMLLDSHDLLLFRLRPLVQRLVWLKPRVLRLRVIDAGESNYCERVFAEPDGRFIGIQRRYTGDVRTTGRAWLTPSRRLATLWAASRSARDGWRVLVGAAGRENVLPANCRGRVFDGALPARQNVFLEHLLRTWSRPGSVLDGVYEFKPGVWLHEKSRVAPGARLVGPLWVGAGVEIDSVQTVIGPLVRCDQSAVTPTQRPFDWVAAHASRKGTPRRQVGRSRLRRVSKRLFDVATGSALLAATAPFYPLFMFLIWREDGRPFFFAHRRQTLRGREFPCYKFRTMRNDAERMKAQLAALNQCDGPQFYIEDDPRLLRIGKLLRRFQIDEWPQFYNVLLGHMSIVGPRPSPDNENQYCPAWREARLSVRPGITGLWQVRRTRQPETDFQEWIRYDLEYVQQDSWRMDLWIITETIKKVLLRR